ncbi:hypothetical protein, partial [Microbacterium lacticum]|uniref:hypothetical protein n=1 Tax=Microbacterium lacticum TaxID=33885 RepID=UPI0028D74393
MSPILDTLGTRRDNGGRPAQRSGVTQASPRHRALSFVQCGTVSGAAAGSGEQRGARGDGAAEAGALVGHGAGVSA